MKKVTFGTPESFVPTKYCKNLLYEETDIQFDISKIEFSVTAQGCILKMPLAADEEVFGFGLQLKGFNHKKSKLCLKVNSDPVANTGDSHAPVPFFVTNKGYGIYFDTARYMEAYCGFVKKRKREDLLHSEVRTDTQQLYSKTEDSEDTVMMVKIPAAQGIDLYIFEGETIVDIVSQYNRFSGGGCDVPEWGLGVLYRAYAKSSEDDVKALVKYFENSDIPCDIIGLEPGWHSGSYSCTYEWNQENFPHYAELIAELRSKGIHVNLWEHAFVSSSSPIYKELFELSGDFEVWKGLVPDFGLDAAKQIFADYHRKQLVEIGIDGFKLDECDSSDFTVSDWSFPDCAQFPSGMDGEQYHQMFGVLYMQTILKALDGRKTLSQVRNAGALSASYPFVLYSDLYNHKDFIRGVVNAGFSGILWTPEVRDAKTKKDFIRRLQTNIFSVQCIINAWYCPEVPWKELDCEDEVRSLLKTRETLVPMLKAAFDQYRDTGKPPVRALVADYTNDKQTYQIDDAYLFCDTLLVAPLTDESDERDVYLPQGRWRDFWTKKEVEPGWIHVKTENIPVFEKI
ncbi:TIM-barrel domain-containing protein [Ructibacterium gallinarum]|uniref:Glycoside hydrolase n=1 Tax=Ructibacterium gallinarum TaxID=2779355 RepID=A0A9D5M4G6_9FIRM|nr:TIM-barrel domain-containing protein [Ructibacterium gallinarum]MBE5039379.1 glycoside hydrolase [Ructibacterium gallinarum]